MINDFQLLGIESTSDINKIKSAFRKRIKELHPDLIEDENAYSQHLLFVETCNAYRRIISTNVNKPTADKKPDKVKTNIKLQNSISIHSDPAYAFYKNGIRYFSRIHPSQWNIDTSRMLNTRIAGQDEDQNIIKGKIMDLVKLFPKAYYYFSIVVHEYPDSEWSFDAGAKMSIIEKRTRMYKKIIESFSTWNLDKKYIKDSYNQLYKKHMKTHEDLKENDLKEWNS